MSLSHKHKQNIKIRMLSEIIKYIQKKLGNRLFLGDVKFTLSGKEFHAVSILMKLLSKNNAGVQQDAGEMLALILEPFNIINPDIINNSEIATGTTDILEFVANSNSEYVALSVQPINITNLLKIGSYDLIGVIRKGIGHFAYMHIESFNNTNNNVSVNHFDDAQITYFEDKSITDFKVSALLYKKEAGDGFSLFDGGGGGGGRHSRRMRKIKKTHRSTRTHHPSHS